MVWKESSTVEINDGFVPGRYRVYHLEPGESKYVKNQTDRLKAGKINEYRKHSCKYSISGNKLMMFLLKEFHLSITRDYELEMERHSECVLFPHLEPILDRLIQLEKFITIFGPDFQKEDILKEIKTPKQFVKIVLTKLFLTCLEPYKYQKDPLDIYHYQHKITVPEWYLLISNVFDGLIDVKIMDKINQIID